MIVRRLYNYVLVDYTPVVAAREKYLTGFIERLAAIYLRTQPEGLGNAVSAGGDDITANFPNGVSSTPALAASFFIGAVSLANYMLSLVFEYS